MDRCVRSLFKRHETEFSILCFWGSSGVRPGPSGVHLGSMQGPSGVAALALALTLAFAVARPCPRPRSDAPAPAPSRGQFRMFSLLRPSFVRAFLFNLAARVARGGCSGGAGRGGLCGSRGSGPAGRVVVGSVGSVGSGWCCPSCPAHFSEVRRNSGYGRIVWGWAPPNHAPSPPQKRPRTIIVY